MNRRLWLRACASLVLLPLPAGAEWRRDNREECDRVDEKLKAIERARRRGYTAKAGQRLQDQRDKLEEKRRAKCR